MNTARNDAAATSLRRELTRRIAKLQTSIRSREASLRKLEQAPPTTKQLLMLTDGDGKEITLPATTRKAGSYCGGGEEVTNERLQRWCSRRRAAQLDNLAGPGTKLDASTIETRLATQARTPSQGMRRRRDLATDPPHTGQTHSAGVCRLHQPLDRRLVAHNMENSLAHNATEEQHKVPGETAAPHWRPEPRRQRDSLSVVGDLRGRPQTTTHELIRLPGGRRLSTPFLLTIEKCHKYKTLQLWTAKLGVKRVFQSDRP